MVDPIVIAPPILSADCSRFGHEIRAIGAAGADWIPYDVMDGIFVPDITFGRDVIEAVRHCSRKPFDVHLMMPRPIPTSRPSPRRGRASSPCTGWSPGPAVFKGGTPEACKTSIAAIRTAAEKAHA